MVVEPYYVGERVDRVGSRKAATPSFIRRWAMQGKWTSVWNDGSSPGDGSFLSVSPIFGLTIFIFTSLLHHDMKITR